jgi:ribosome biogenesis GTPase / thiamine phosphate phosphatase
MNKNEITITGRVIKIYGTVYYVESDNEIFSCVLRGKLKLLQSKTDENDPLMKEKLKLLQSTNTKNPIVTGDLVNFVPMESTEIKDDGYRQGIIKELLPRKNKISRSFVHNKKIREHYIASNVDYVLCVNSVKNPKLNTAFIDRVLVSSESEGIEPVIIVNKIDLDASQENDTDDAYSNVQDKVKQIYNPLEYKIFNISAKENLGLDELKDFINDKIVVLTGYSGVGKSTIINSILGKKLQRVAEISSYSKKGKHTTTTSVLIKMPKGGYIIDTPGLREFGIYNIDKDDLYHYFRELEPYTGKCRYTPCTHSHEPDCAVKEDVEKGIINEERYYNYLKILDTLEGI